MTPKGSQSNSSALSTGNCHHTHCITIKVKIKQVYLKAHYGGGSLPSNCETISYEWESGWGPLGQTATPAVWWVTLLASVQGGPQNKRDPWSDPAWQFLCKMGPICWEASHPHRGKRWAESLTNILVFGSHSQLSFNTQTAFPVANWQQRAHQHLNKRLVNASVRQVCMPRLAKVSCQGFSKREFL